MINVCICVYMAIIHETLLKKYVCMCVFVYVSLFVSLVKLS